MCGQHVIKALGARITGASSSIVSPTAETSVKGDAPADGDSSESAAGPESVTQAVRPIRSRSLAMDSPLVSNGFRTGIPSRNTEPEYRQ